MPTTSPNEPIAYDIMALIDVESKFYNVPQHDIFLDNSTPIYNPMSIISDKAPLTAIQHLQLAAHPGHTALDVNQWGAMKSGYLFLG